MPATAEPTPDELLELLVSFADRPYDFAYACFPWGEPGTELEKMDGPDTWQAKVLWDLQEGLISFSEAIRIAIRSGHGVGKSAIFSILTLWAIGTAVDTRGRITANTKEQLMRVLWGELAKWHRLFIGASLFKLTATAIMSVDPGHEKTWRIDAIPWSEENPEAFAGLHNFGKRIFIACDEASAIADVIWEVLDGATTDANTQIIWLVAGNPTRNSGRFRDCFERFSAQWRTYRVDARTSKFANKELLARWAEAHGEDSDFFRVRVRGEFPNAATTQLIPIETIRVAQARLAEPQAWEPLILAADIARFGNNETVCAWRQGRDAKSLPVLRWNGLTIVETASRIATLIVERQPDGVFIDEGGVGGGVVDLLRSLGHSVIGVNFGASPSTRPEGILVSNKRSEMYVAMREWLRSGGAIAAHEDLSSQLVSIEYHYNRKTEIQLVSKEDMRSIGKPSPDWADALAMTFAYAVVKKNRQQLQGMTAIYDPLSESAALGAWPESPKPLPPLGGLAPWAQPERIH